MHQRLARANPQTAAAPPTARTKYLTGLLEALPLHLALVPEVRTELPLGGREEDGLFGADAVLVGQHLVRAKA